jgi:hypothetical protein
MWMVRAGVGALLAAGVIATAARATAGDQPLLVEKAKGFFKTYCYRCHGRDGANEGGLNYILDSRQLVNRRKIVPGKPEKSRLFRRLIDDADPMPPAEEKLRPGKDEIALIKAWIEAGAPDTAAVAKRAFIPASEVLQAMHNDLERLPERRRRFTRYFTLTHLYNAGLPPEELQSFRHGLSKLINSLSWASVSPCRSRWTGRRQSSASTCVTINGMSRAGKPWWRAILTASS